MLKIIISTVFLVTSLHAAFVGQEAALDVASSIYVQNKPASHSAEFKVINTDVIYDSKGSAALYIFNLYPTGFVLVSAEDRTYPALGYSYESTFKLDGMPTSLQSIFDGYKNDIENIRSINSFQNNEIRAQWDLHKSVNPIYEDSRNVSPLIDAEFDQGGNWNNYIQTQIGFNGPVGCVAVAMAQVMHYWSFPYVGEGSNSYYENDYGLILALLTMTLTACPIHILQQHHRYSCFTQVFPLTWTTMALEAGRG